MLIGCGLRRGELLGLHVESIQLREEHWVIADLLGKAGHIRTVPIPEWVKAAVDAWKEASGISEGALFRSINKSGRSGRKRQETTAIPGAAIHRRSASRAQDRRRPVYEDT
jgi:integrase